MFAVSGNWCAWRPICSSCSAPDGLHRPPEQRERPFQRIGTGHDPKSHQKPHRNESPYPPHSCRPSAANAETCQRNRYPDALLERHLRIICRPTDTMDSGFEFHAGGQEPCRCTPIAAPSAATSLKKFRTSPPSKRPNALGATACWSARSPRQLNFKGAGWYVNDYASPSSASESSSESSSDSSKPAAPAETNRPRAPAKAHPAHLLPHRARRQAPRPVPRRAQQPSSASPRTLPAPELRRQHVCILVPTCIEQHHAILRRQEPVPSRWSYAAVAAAPPATTAALVRRPVLH